MIRKTITYTDFNDEEQTEEHYFHLSKSELIDMELSQDGGLSVVLPELVKSKNSREMMRIFKEILAKSYGVRSPDGKQFDKNEELTSKFMSSLAFDALFTELVSNQKAAGDFIIGLMPKDLMNDSDVIKALETSQEPDELPWANREPTPQELTTMSREQLLEVWKRRQNSQ